MPRTRYRTRTTRSISKCSLCREPGHNRRTCWLKNVTLPRGEPPANSDLDLIPILPIVETPTINTENDDCPICMEKLTGDKNICITKCGHKFCCECLIRAARNNNDCPLCRQKLTDHEVEPPSQHGLTNDEVYSLIDANDYYVERFDELRDIFLSSRFDDVNNNMDIEDMDTDDDDEVDEVDEVNENITVSESIEV